MFVTVQTCCQHQAGLNCNFPAKEDIYCAQFGIVISFKLCYTYQELNMNGELVQQAERKSSTSTRNLI